MEATPETMFGAICIGLIVLFVIAYFVIKESIYDQAEREAKLNLLEAEGDVKRVVQTDYGPVHVDGTVATPILHQWFLDKVLDKPAMQDFLVDYEQAHRITRLPNVRITESKHPLIEAPEIPEPLKSMVPLLVGASRRCLSGTSESGKTTVARMLMSFDVRDSKKLMFVSPHEQSSINGVPVVGIGRDYRTIENVLQSLIDLMTMRYQEIGLGRYQHLQHEPIAIYVDEWTSIKKQCKNAPEYLATLLTEGRKASMDVTVLTHSLNTDMLGLDKHLRQNLLLVNLIGGNGLDYRAEHFSYSPTGKLTIEPYLHPGSEAVDTPQVDSESFIVDLPSSEYLIAHRLRSEGKSDTFIARQVHDTSTPNARQIKNIRELLS